ncbi:MAG: energy-coupling factor ABC transporter ATP-binding protein [Chitinophagales bacterium]
MKPPVIELEQVTVVKGEKNILDIDHLMLRMGERVSFMGPNGAGKTTLLNVMALLQPTTTGTLSLFGEDTAKQNTLQLRRRMGMVFQEPLLLDISVYSNIELGLRFREVGKSERADRVNYWLDKLGIRHLSDRSPRFLSGGEAQRTNLARAFVLEPEIIFFDEPFNNIDSRSRDNIIDQIDTFLKNSGATAIFVLHQMEHTVKLAYTINYLDDGKLILTKRA